MHSMRRSYALALSVVLVLAAQADARMSDSKFQQLLDFSRQHLSHNFTVHEHFRLLFAALPVEEIGWASPDSIDQDRARAYEGTNFNVVLVHAPPLVVIDDPEAIELGDPGVACGACGHAWALSDPTAHCCNCAHCTLSPSC